jgi:prepilin-type N-terminal cleavage/methylation domain-containing protein
MNPFRHTNPLAKGFSLLELAVVLTIIGVLLAGLLPTLSSQVEQQRMTETRKQLNEIRDALIGFAVMYGRLPCPANGALNTGLEATTGVGAALVCTSITAGSNSSRGVVPWATLGVSETDAWGRRLSYQVTSNYADGTDGTGAGTCNVSAGISFQMCSQGNLNVLTSVGGTNLATSLPVVVLSHGVNGTGAFNTQGIQLAGAAGDELENANTTNSLVSHDPVQNGYDDLVIWVPPSILFNRMVAAGKLP